MKRGIDLRYLLATALLLLWQPSWAAPARYALVLANGSYSTGALKNPHSDADLMAATLQGVGFTVERRNDVGRTDMYEAVRSFTASLPQGAIALVYYAGHGMQINGKNYLIPIDMVPTSEAGVAMRAFSATTLTEKLGASKAGVSIVILDACRNNPFRPAPSRASRSFEGLGLAKIVTPRGMVIAYSTAPGQLAEDGAGRKNSLYTATLAQEIKGAGMPLEQILKNVGNVVRRQTFDDQQPWFESSLVEDFYFVPPVGVQLAAAPPIRKRGGPAASTRDLGGSWFSTMGRAEWTQLDAELDRRAERVTPEQIPDLQRQAEKNNLVAQTTLGLMYLAGPMLGTVKAQQSGRFQRESIAVQRAGANNTLALKWLRRAAEAGFPPAQAQLGEIFYEGRITSRDIEQARLWLSKAAEHDYPRARINLAQLNATEDNSPDGYMQLFREMMPGVLPSP